MSGGAPAGWPWHPHLLRTPAWPHPPLCKKQSLGSHEAPGTQAFRRPGGGSQQVLRRMAAREAAGEPRWLEGCWAAGPQRWSAGSCCWAGRELQRPVRQGRGGAAQMRRGEPLCRVSGVPQGPASSEPAEPALCQPAPGQSLLEGLRPPQVSAPSLRAAAQPGSPRCPEQTPPARSMAGLPRWAGTQALPRPRGEEG